MKILIITDIHYGEDTNYPGQNGENYINSFGSQFENFLPKIHSLINEHDLVINLGDLIHDTTAESDVIEYKKAMELFGHEKPIKHVFGNHDLNNLSRDQLAEITGEEKSYYSFDLGRCHHIVLCGFRNSRAELVKIDEEQIAWLQQDLDKTNLSTIVYCHYPLDEQSTVNNYYFKDRPERAFIENRVIIRSVIESSKKVLAVFNGHLHFFNQEAIHGILYVTAPAFTENNGKHEPQAECLSVSLEDSNVHILLKNLA